MTAQRKVILEELRRVDTHPTADTIYAMVRRRLPRISLATVYRNLEWLAGAGLIRKYESGGSQRRFDGNPSDHYHVRCVRCGRLDDIPMEPSPTLDQAARGNTDYQIVGHRLEYLGVCPACRTSPGQAIHAEPPVEGVADGRGSGDPPD
jgi:Fur family ferric uptake transcriptional regulator